MSASCISSLPLEILASIFSYTSRQDQRYARLVSHSFNTAAQMHLYRIIFLKLNLRSFQHLQAISRHEDLSKHVRAICFDPRQLSERMWSPDFAWWRDHIAGNGMGLYMAKLDDIRKLYTPDTLKGYFRAYGKFMEDFHLLLSHRKWMHILCPAVQNLPGLMEIYYTDGIEKDPRRLVTDINDGLERMTPDLDLAREILAVPNAPSSYDTGFWRVLQLLGHTNCATNIKKISGLDLESKEWKETGKDLARMLGRFSNLQDLALTFDSVDATYKEDFTDVPEILAAATNLRSLSLRVRYGRGPDDSRFHYRSLNVRDLIRSRWPHLQRLVLYGMIIEEEDLREIIKDHASTLRCLKLSHVELRLTSVPHKYKRENWVRLLSSLVRSTALECMVFDAISTAMVDYENMGRYWYAAAIKREFSYKYPCGELFVHTFRDGQYRLDLSDGLDTSEVSVEKEDDDMIEYGLPSGMVADWIFGDAMGHFDGELREMTDPRTSGKSLTVV